MSHAFATLGDNYWMNQTKLVGGRRADLAVPLVFPVGSKAFQMWQSSRGFDINAWSSYRQ